VGYTLNFSGRVSLGDLPVALIPVAVSPEAVTSSQVKIVLFICNRHGVEDMAAEYARFTFDKQGLFGKSVFSGLNRVSAQKNKEDTAGKCEEK